MGPKRKSSKQQHICFICSKSCPTYPALELHMNMHTRERPYMCPYCDSCYASASSLWVHENAVHLGRKYICDFCDKECNALANLIQHRKRAHPEEARTTERPKDNYVDTVDRRELVKRRPQPEKAPELPIAVPPSPPAKTPPESPAPAPQEDKPFKCDLCDKSFKERRFLTAHLKRQIHSLQAAGGTTVPTPLKIQSPPGSSFLPGSARASKIIFRRPKPRPVLKWDASFFLHMNRYVPER